MTHKFTKQELKSPDAILDKLNHLVGWAKANSGPISMVIGLLMLGGIVWNTMSYFNDKKEIAAQEKYFALEKSYLDQKQKFEEAEIKSKDTEKGAKEKAKGKTDLKADAKPEVKPELKKTTGDLQKDYGNLPQEFKQFISENPKTQAAKMAVMNLVEILIKYNKLEEALETVKIIDQNLYPKELLSALVLNQKATVLANKSDCQGAIDTWAPLVKNQQINYLHNEINLRMGLCYEMLGDKQKATEMLTEASKKTGPNNGPGSDNSISQEAEKYLRLIKLQNKGS